MGSKKVLVLVSGGVDSAVCAALMNKVCVRARVCMHVCVHVLYCTVCVCVCVHMYVTACAYA